MPELNIIGATEQNRYYPYQGNFRVTRKSFWAAGQDSYTDPPAQNPDLFQSLTNIEPVLTGVLQRRQGYTLFYNTAVNPPVREIYSYRNEINLTRRIVFTTPSTVFATDESGNITSNPIFIPTLTANGARMVLSRSYGYFADGIASDYRKWDGTDGASTGTTNWGISVQANPGSISGPNAPTAAASVPNGAAVGPWANPTNIEVQDGAYATITLPGPPGLAGASAFLRGTNFGFSVPAGAVITGIKIDVKGLQSNMDPQSLFSAQLIKAGTPIGGFKNLQLPLVNGFVTYGGPTDVWGQSFIGSDINNTGFGVQFLATAQSAAGEPCTFSADFVQITVYISGGSITLGAPSGTGITLISGRIYSLVFQNSVAGTTSNLYPFSASTGPLTNQGQPISGLPVNSDPQVDTKLLLATADGGDETTLYLVAQLTNAATTYTDGMADSTLLTQPVYQQTDQNGNLHGVANNNPPPLINFPTKHKGRIFGVVGPTLYFSKNLDDVTTSTGTITGKWEEAWPATYSLDLSENAETATGILSDGQTLYLGSDATVRRLIGDSPDNFQEPEVIFNNAGVVNQEVWKTAYSEGQPVATMWLTPDNRVMFSDFNTFQDVGTPIQDILNSLNSQVTQTTAHACFVTRGPMEYYMLYVATGSNTSPDTCLVFNMRTKKWCVWKPTDKITASLLNINSTGVPQWFIAASTGPIYRWDNTLFQDRNNNTPVSYAATAKTEWLDFGDEGLTKGFNKITVTTSDPQLTVAVQGATRDTDLDSGGKLVLQPTPLLPEAFGDLFVPMLAQDGFYKWYQVTFASSAASTTVDLLDGFDFEIAPSLRT